MSKRLLFFIAMAAFVCYSVIMAPASLVYRVAEDKIVQVLPNLSISGIKGTIWQGQSQIKFRQIPNITGSWQVSPLHLLVLTAKSSIKINAEGLKGSFDLELTPWGGSINNLNVVAQEHFLNQITIPYGLDLSGEISLAKARLDFSRRWLTGGVGVLNWGGGIVHIQTPEKIHTVNLPILHGDLSIENNILKLGVDKSNLNMMTIYLKPDGWAKVAINYAFMELTSIPLPKNSLVGDEPAIVLEEKVL